MYREVSRSLKSSSLCVGGTVNNVNLQILKNTKTTAYGPLLS